MVVMVNMIESFVLMKDGDDDEDETMDLQVFLEGGGEEASRLVDEAGEVQVILVDETREVLVRFVAKQIQITLKVFCTNFNTLWAAVAI